MPGAKARLGDETWEEPMLAQPAQIVLDDATIAAVVGTLASDHKPVAIEKGRIERQLKELALDVVAGPEMVSAPLTPEAYSHAMAMALPQVVMARPDRCSTRDFNLHHPDRRPR